MNKKSMALFFVMTLVISMSMMPMLTTPVYAVHTPEITLTPEYSDGTYPEWKEFEVYNDGPDEIVIVSGTHPEDFKPVEYSFPSGWTATYYPLLRQVIFESTNYTKYYIGTGQTRYFEIKFGDGPKVEGEYEFIVSTTDIWEQAYTDYVYQYIDKTDPTVEIIYPLDGAVIRRPDIWINATAEDTGLFPSGINRVALWIDGIWVTPTMNYDSDRDVYYWYNDTLSKGERLWYNTRALAYDNAGNFGLSAFVEFFWYFTGGIGISPTSGPVGTTVTVTGIGFTPGSDVDVTFYNTIDHGVVATALTDEETMFETSFNVPETPKGFYTVNAIDSEGFSDAETFEVVPWMTISPTSGTVDTLIEVSGTGFPDGTDVYIWWGGFASDRLDYATTTYLTWNGSWTFRITTVGGDLHVATVESNDKGSFTASFHAPESWGGYHPIWAQWIEIVVIPGPFPPFPIIIPMPVRAFQEQIFRILPSMEIDPSSGVSGQYVNLMGEGWAYWGDYEMWNDANANLEWDECEQGFIYESEGVGLVVDFGPNERYIDESHFILNGEADLAWFDKVYDPVGLDARGTIIYRDTQHDVVGAIGSPFLQVPFLQPGDYDVTVYRFIEWEKMLDRHPGLEPYEIVLFENHHIYSYVESVSTTFTIEPLQIDDSEILDRLDELEATIIGVIEDAEGNILAVIETNLGTITARFDQIDAKLVDIQGDIATISTKLGQIEVKVDNINPKLTDIQGRIGTIETDIGTIQTDISNINGKITSIEGTLATIETDIGTIKVDIASINPKLVDLQGDIATIHTEVGEIEAKAEQINATVTAIYGKIAVIESTVGVLEDLDISAINATLEDIQGRTAIIQTTLGTIQEDIDNINGKIVALEGDVATIETDVGTIKTSLEDVNAKITVNKDNIASIETDMGTIEGRLTSIEGDVATIETDIGTIQTSTDSIQTTGESIKTDTSLQPATVALSLIAAISAIAAAVMVLRKVYVK